ADTKDWQSHRITVPKLIDNALEDAQPGGIILLHDGGGDRSKTVQALPKLITQLKQRGYQFVTVSELLDIPD
ncbi:MAG: polysaccharide deacetylase family protein, partial [Coleofasciculus sp. C2-GNP5-27]